MEGGGGWGGWEEDMVGGISWGQRGKSHEAGEGEGKEREGSRGGLRRYKDLRQVRDWAMGGR